MDAYLKNELRKFFGIEHIVLAGRGALGIYAALCAWNATGKVAVPSAVCQDVIASILMAGWEPIFCDVQKETGLTSIEEWSRARLEGATAAIVVHLYGNAANTLEVKKIFSTGLVIDDAAQALGAKSQDNSFFSGTGGDIGIISFGNSKHIQVGGAALIFKDRYFANACKEILTKVVTSSLEERQLIELTFRSNLKIALDVLRINGDNSRFNGLLSGYFPALRLDWQTQWSYKIAISLSKFPEKLAQRREKMMIWREVIDGSGLVPVGMEKNSSPWRFSCRFPGCDWRLQFQLGELLRLNGINVSHWYLPSHWLILTGGSDLPGSENLAMESFQFWLDESIEKIQILNSKKIFDEVFNFGDPIRMGV
jgi:hypothetical protein